MSIATVSDQSIGPFALGANDRRPEFDLRTKDGTFVRGASNADISSVGSISRRAGYELALPGTDCHSLWSGRNGTFFVDGGTLMKLSPALSASPVCAVTPHRQVSFCEHGSDVYFSNGDAIGRIDSSGAHALGCPPVTSPVMAIASSTGSMPAGQYELCVTFETASGEQSVPQVLFVSLPQTGGIQLLNLPDQFPADVALLNIFCSAPNGEIMGRAAQLTAAQTTTMLTTVAVGGARCPTLLLEIMPAGDIVRIHNGRMVVAVGNALVYSEPYAFALFDPTKNYIPFEVPITMVQSVQGGLYLAADQTYWLAGDLAKSELNPVLPYGAVRGSGGDVPNKNEVWWMSERGTVVGDQDGNVKNMQEDNVSVAPAQRSAGLYREADGVRHLISSLFGSAGQGAAAHSYMDAEIVRKGTP